MNGPSQTGRPPSRASFSSSASPAGLAVGAASQRSSSVCAPSRDTSTRSSIAGSSCPNRSMASSRSSGSPSPPSGLRIRQPLPSGAWKSPAGISSSAIRSIPVQAAAISSAAPQSGPCTISVPFQLPISDSSRARSGSGSIPDPLPEAGPIRSTRGWICSEHHEGDAPGAASWLFGLRLSHGEMFPSHCSARTWFGRICFINIVRLSHGVARKLQLSGRSSERALRGAANTAAECRGYRRKASRHSM